MKRKLAVVNVFLPPQSIGGATRVVADNMTILGRDYGNDYELTAFCSDASSYPPHIVNVYAWNGIRVYRAGILERVNMDWHYSDEKISDLFTKFLEIEKPDLVHVHCIQRLGTEWFQALRKKGIPYVVTTHDAWWISDHQFLVDQMGDVYEDGHPDFFQKYRLPDGVSWDDSLTRRAILFEALDGAERVLTVSKSFAELYRRNGIAKISVVPNGVDSSLHDIQRHPSPSGRVRVAHIGGMSAHKGYDLLREVASSTRFSNIEFLIVDHSKSEGYMQQSDWMGSPTTFVGRLKQENISTLYANIDVLLAPSTWPESFGLVTREAGAAGVWVVASNIGAIGEDVLEGEDGFVITAGSREALRDVLLTIDTDSQRFLEPPSRRTFMSREQQVQQLHEIYQDILGAA